MKPTILTNSNLLISVADSDDGEEEEGDSDSIFDFAAPVKSFLEKSHKKMRSYFSGEDAKQTGSLRHHLAIVTVQ